MFLIFKKVKRVVLQKDISECGVEETGAEYQTSEVSSPHILNEFVPEFPEVEINGGNNTFQTSANAFGKTVP